MKEKIYKLVFGSRSKPGLGRPDRIHFISLNKYIKNFSNKYIKNGDKLLDFGCGNGPYKKIYNKKKINYIGIDIGESPEFNNNYIVYKGGKIPFKDNEFDIITSTQVFEHLENPFFYALELERITKKGGYLLITIAHVWEYHPYPNHYFNIMKGAIPNLFKNCEIIDIKGDTTEIQNIIIFFMKYIGKIRILGLLIIFLINICFFILDKIGLYKIGPVKYNKMAGNILIILRKK